VSFLLAGLQPPTNVARSVRELQESLYSRRGLLSPLALPPLIPLLFLDPSASEVGADGSDRLAGTPPPGPGSRAVRRLAEDLRSSFRGESAPRAPRLRTGGLAVVREPDAATAALFWELGTEPARGSAHAALGLLADLFRAQVQAGPGWPPLLPRPFSVHPGFFLALQEGELDLNEAAAELPPLEPLSFPAAALSLWHVRRLHLEPLPAEEVQDSGAAQPVRAGSAAPLAAAPPPGSSAPIEQPPWWRALFWEELLNVPLKKPPREKPQETG
jgi:hypothetical protein